MNQKIKTGIYGLDDLLDGGFLKNRSILIQGEAGTGKSTLGMQFLVKGIMEMDEPGLIVSMEYDHDDLIEDMEKFGWPIRDLISHQKLKIVSPPGGIENPTPLNVDELVNVIHKETGAISAKRVVIDSLNSLELSLSNTLGVRRELLRFITLIRDLDCTTLLISEMDNNDSNLYTYLSHGVINLYNKKMGANRIRAIEVLKMRGTNHSTLTHSMSIDPRRGIEVLPHEIDLS